MAKKQIEQPKPEPRVILGLDVSTETVGISLVVKDDNGSIIPVEVTHLKMKVPDKYKGAESLFMKNDIFREKLEELHSKYVIDSVVIEEPLVSSNNAITVSTLLKFNGIVSWTVYHVLNVIPEYISSYDARKYGMPQLMAVRKHNKKGETYAYKKIRKAINNNELVEFGAYPFDVSKKDIIWGYVSERFPNINWVTNKKGELKKENFDASDSLICILGWLNKRVYGDTEPEIVDYSEKDFEGKKVMEYTTSFCGETFTKRIELVTETKPLANESV